MPCLDLGPAESMASIESFTRSQGLSGLTVVPARPKATLGRTFRTKPAAATATATAKLSGRWAGRWSAPNQASTPRSTITMGGGILVSSVRIKSRWAERLRQVGRSWYDHGSA